MPINISTHEGVFPWNPACWLRVTGVDAANFLQGQFTNDLRALERQRTVYGLWLTVKGKVLADSFVIRGREPSEFWIGSYFSEAATIRERLEAFIIADDVTLEDQTAEWAGITCFGVGPDDLAVEQNGQGEAVTFPGRRDQAPSVEYVYRRATGEPAWLAGARRLSAEEVEARRIRAGIPAVPMDVGPGDLPNEAGLETDAISYTKGCYLGQEVMARLKSMGQVRRRLLRVRGREAGPPAVPAAVFKQSRQVGDVRSAADDGAGGWVGLAMISRLHAQAGDVLAFAADGAPAVELVDGP